MSKWIYKAIILSLATAATAIAAGAEYDYPPEFADLFGQFRVITPEEAQIDVALYGDDPWHTYAGGVILEPILLRCINGIPAYYVVVSYNGRNSEIRQDMENLIRLLNDQRGFDPERLAEMLSALEPHWGDFYTFGRPAWTHGSGGRMMTPYLPQFLVDFQGYFYNIKAESDTSDKSLCSVYMIYPALTSPVFGFGSTGVDRRYYFAQPQTGEVVSTNEGELDSMFFQRIEHLLNCYAENPGSFLKEHEYWQGVKGLFEEVEKEGKYLKVREHVGATDGELDGKTIDDVPEFNVSTAPGDNYWGDCWVWSMVSDLVFHSQCENYYGRGLVWRERRFSEYHDVHFLKYNEK
jgi:hypothetical protein